MDNKIINGVWAGGELTNIQKLCIRSYIDHGHEFRLWLWNPVSNAPHGTVVRDPREVLPSTIPTFTGANYFSDYFRVVLINQVGGWYVDLDTVCLNYFEFSQNYAYVSESRLPPMKATNLPTERPSPEVQEYLSGCIFKAPARDPMLKWIIEEIERMDTMGPKNWICMGPEMFQKTIPLFGRDLYVQPPSVFDALNYNELEHFVTGGVQWFPFPKEAVAIHLRTSFWQEKYHPILKPNGVFAPDSLYEQLKRRHGV